MSATSPTDGQAAGPCPTKGRQPLRSPAQGGAERSAQDLLIQLQGVCKGYPEGGAVRVVLEDLDLAIRRGESVAVIGPSGSGKSTLLNLIGAMEAPDRGALRFDGMDLARLDETARTLFRRRHLGFIFQQLNLVPTLTVLENLLLPLELNGALDRDGRRHARALLERVGLQGREGTFPEHLSGGERQRVAVARALVHGPGLLLADEPTGSLDRETARTVLGLFNELRRERGMTALIATHASEVAAAADRVVALQGGRLDEVSAA
ncbi:ABC transporter ATP-binding protein [Halorhodospira halophila]|nr:ABC transporter ATP-binding protein [Halorhodospira halophila]MBK5936992.1 ABC transporter ATP-binding protein [Halorhodospira halophila]MBK5943736.1 ABC transporter ATP-binding protein [Halorhodospira halophila]